uniref:Uncharacterized protein n=1 Tax=Panagrolaimus davidi TaxID=227884 RepID=A0A914Q2D9_9BILA
MGVLFRYARKRENKECNECGEKIPIGALVSCYQTNNHKEWHHFDCFWKQRAVDEFRKSNIMISLKHRPTHSYPPTVSLEEYDRTLDGFQLEINLADLTKIREQFALAKEHKTEFYIPRASKTANLKCYDRFCARSNSVVGCEQLGLYFQGNNYHPECLLETGKINVDAKEIRDYDSLSEDDKKLLDELFEKDNAFYLLPKAETPFFVDEICFCAALKCSKFSSKIGYKIQGLRIRYQTKTYHPDCFAKMDKVNMDGEEIGNYHTLSYPLQLRLRKLFGESNDFDIPLIEKAKRDDYCTLADCPAANGQPSKFPWPYTIKQGELHIKFHGDIYHLRCFKSTEKSEIDVKDFRGYDSLSQRTKHMLEENFEDIEMDIEEDESSGNDDDSDGSDCSDDSDIFMIDQTDNDDDIEGPPAKKPKMEPQMQDENVRNEYDNDQEPFDGTNVKEEMSEPIILQINTLNESYNAGVGPQTVNDREEREGNQESENLVVENVVSGNVMEDIKEIPEIKKELKGEPEIITLDDEAETDTVKIEPQNDIHQNGKEIQPIIIQEPVVNTVPQLFRLEAFIESTLGTLKIPFTREAYGFLRKIKYTNIPATASPGTTFEIFSSTDSFFKCLSLFFTGEEKYYYGIKPETQLYIFNNFKTFGTIDKIDFSKVDKSSEEFQKLHECNKLTNAHFTLICSWLKCRIGIYSNGRLSGKYGNWNGIEPIFLIENNNGFYKPVLSLN